MADRKQNATNATQATKANPSPSSHPSHEIPENAPRTAATTRRPGLFRKGGRA
jgi:hypothetical protein